MPFRSKWHDLRPGCVRIAMPSIQSKPKVPFCCSIEPGENIPAVKLASLYEQVRRSGGFGRHQNGEIYDVNLERIEPSRLVRRTCLVARAHPCECSGAGTTI